MIQLQNINIMKKFFILLVAAVLGLTACNNLTADKAKDAVMRGEQDRIPLLVQQLMIIEDITVDSMRITVDSEPMEGYLYTTWKSGEKESQIIVPVQNIHTSEGYIEWESDWESATKAYVMGMFKL